MLKNFKIDTNRDKLFPSVEFYQMGLIDIAQKAVDNGIDQELLPSWSKFNSSPIKARGFWSYMLQALFEGKHNTPQLDTEIQFESYGDHKVAMMFLGGITNEALELAAKYADNALRGYIVLPVYGKTTNNKKAEKYVKDQIEIAQQDQKNVLILAANMAQRSFSIPEITELYLAYDAGAEGATIQKMSRALTPSNSNPDKIGRIVSLSFDPNRDDKFDAMIVQTADNYNDKHNKKDIREAMRDVLETIDIFECSDVGRNKIEVDYYIEQLLSRKTGINRVLGKTTDMSKIPDDVIIALAEGNTNYTRADKTQKALKGKTKHFQQKPSKRKNENEEKAWEKKMAKAREAIVSIIENVDILICGTNSNSINQALEYIRCNPEFKQFVAIEFGISYDIIEILFESGALNENLLQLTWKAN